MEARQPSENNYSLPIGLRYNLGIADSVPAVRNISQYLSSNATTFSGTGTTVCRIPVSSGNFLDLKNALLQFEFDPGAKNVQFDGSVAGIIEEITVSAGGQTIETVRGYGLLDAVLDQYSSSDGTLRQNHTLKGGVAGINDTPAFVAAGGGSATVTNNGITITAASGGAMTLSSIGGVGYDQEQTQKLDANKTRKYAFALRALGFFNPATNKMMPPNTPFMVSIKFAPGSNCLKNLSDDVSAPYSVQNCELHIPEVQILDPAFMARMQARMSQGLAWKCNSYDHFVNTYAGGTGATTVQISARARSLKGLMTVMRNQANVSANQKFKLSKRSIQYVDDFCYRIGSSQYPSQKCQIEGVGGVSGGTAAGSRITGKANSGVNVSEAYSHVLRLTGNLNTQTAHNLISQESFAQSELNNGTGLLAMDLSAFADGSVNSGLNTLNNMPVSLEINRTAATGSAVIQTDTYSIHELVIIRDASGQLSSVY
jgi:hypothetical protein